jgi:tRNA threonylcarbamoyladenosine biosynthesis protein TsaB
VAFGAGPGAFTGLRCACAVAQGLAFGARIPVVAVDSLMLVAEDSRATLATGEPADTWVAMDARMDEAYAARYRYDGRRWQVLDAPALYTLEALAARWRSEPPQRVVGNAVQAFADRLPFGAAVTQAMVHDRAEALLRLALQRHADGALVSAAQAMPLYLRDKVALTSAEREAARAKPEAERG